MRYTPLTPQPTMSAPHVVENYPYGFRLRTQIRYWVETTKHGQRLVSQTLNPKSGAWNKPKASTYSDVVLAALDEEGHVANVGVSTYSLEEVRAFREAYAPSLSDYQKTELTNMEKMLEVYSKVTWEVKTQKFRDLDTGETLTSVPMSRLSRVVKVNDLGDPVDEEAEEAIKREDIVRLNKAAVGNAAAATSAESALATFGRAPKQ